MDRLIQYWRMFRDYIPIFATILVIVIFIFAWIYFSRIKRGERLKTPKTTFLEMMITVVVLGILFVTLSPSYSYITFQYSVKLRLNPLFQGDVSQYILPLGRILSVTDFVLNTIGSVIGYMLFILLRLLISKKKSLNVVSKPNDLS
jgi:glycopeptide antibiotics resistance protein